MRHFAHYCKEGNGLKLEVHAALLMCIPRVFVVNYAFTAKMGL